MRVCFSDAQRLSVWNAIVAHPDAQEIAPNDYVLDLYDLEPPMSMELSLENDGIEVLAAEYLAFDEAMDGWYMARPVENAQALSDALSSLV